MTLTDAGPLIALIDAGEPDHERCRATFDELDLPLVTTWPAFTEAMHLLGRAAGWPGQRALWALVDRDVLVVADVDGPGAERSADLMRRYADLPMDLADATLVALGEQLSSRRVFSLDRHFHAYRLRGGRSLQVVPA